MTKTLIFFLIAGIFKMRDIVKSAAFVCIVLFSPCYFFRMNLLVGPKPDESGKYVYSEDGIKKHCLYCPKSALYNSSENEDKQELNCLAKYGDSILDKLTPFERENKKYPICKKGQVPGCGPPPQEKQTESYIWSCDAGFSNVNYSVYFCCALICERTRSVAFSYYCNENLQWELVSSVASGVICKKKTPTTGCGPPPEDKATEGYIWSCDPEFSNMTYSVNFLCPLICEKSRSVAWSYYCNEDLQWKLNPNVTTDVTCKENTPAPESYLSQEKVILIVACFFTLGISGCVTLIVIILCISQKRNRNVRRTHTASRNLVGTNGPNTTTEMSTEERASPLGEEGFAKIPNKDASVSANWQRQPSRNLENPTSICKLENQIIRVYQQSDNVRAEFQCSLVSNECQHQNPRSPLSLDNVSVLRLESLNEEDISTQTRNLSDVASNGSVLKNDPLE